jgi:DNA-binding CsgD family transcriptional regulator
VENSGVRWLSKTAVNQKNLSLFAYQAIQSPQKQYDFLASLSEIMEAKAALIKVEDHDLRWAFFRLTHGMDRETIDSYCSYYVGLNPWALRGVKTPGEVRTSDQLVSERELRDTEFYHGWMKPRGWMHTAAVGLTTVECGRVILVAFRPPNHPFTEKELAILNDNAPHLAEAAQIGKSLWEHKNTINRLRNGAVQIDPLKRSKLSPTESRIALAIAQGQTTKEIAFKAGIAESTVRSHVKSIYKKLDISRQADLVRLLLDPTKQ